MRFYPVLFACLTLLLLDPAGAQQERVDLKLVLTADGSGSIDDAELRLQREGYATAITSRRVLEAIAEDPRRRIAVAMIEWGGPDSQHVVVDWTIVDGPETAQRFAAALLAAPRQASGFNSISNAIVVSANMIHRNAIESARKVIDVSADGGQFGGVPLPEARALAVGSGITINGLAISRPGSGRPGGTRFGISLEDHFARDIIGGNGAFVLVAETNRNFADAVMRKLVLEIADHGATGENLRRADR
jgi:hypothetical protein